MDRIQRPFGVSSRAAEVAHTGSAGSGRTEELIDDALLMTDQGNVQDELHLDIRALIDLLLCGTASGFARQALPAAVTSEHAEHLTTRQLIDMDVFGAAMASLGQDGIAISPRAAAGADGLPEAAQLVSAG